MKISYVTDQQKQAKPMMKHAAKTNLFLTLTALVSMTAHTQAQTPVLPIAFGTAIVGVAPGGSTTACTTTMPLATGVVVPGDGCPGTQATLNGPYGAAVDNYGNVYFGDYNTFTLRVLYMGGAALSAAIQNANPSLTFTPQVGYVYTLAGSRQAAIATSGSPKAYYCNANGTGTIGIGSNADGCPATYAYAKPRNPVIDADGNVIFTSASGSAPIRVVYVGGTKMANLIKTLDGSTVTPQPGYIYSLMKSSASGYAGDGALATDASVHAYAFRDVAVDSGGNIYMSDGTNSFTAPAYASNNDVRRIDGTTGILSTYAGSPGTGSYACAQGSTAGCAGVFSGDGGPATAATFNSPYTIFFDRFDNLYITDYNDGRLRVVYKAGTVPGLSNLTAGNVYTVAGGGAVAGTAATANVAGTSLSFGTIYTGGIDPNGNIYFVDGTSKLVWRIDAKTGIANYVGGGKASTTAGTVCATGSTLTATDKLGDGCPITQSSVVTSGKLPFDRFGNFYEIENGNNLLRKFSFNTLLPTTAVGASATQPLAFEPIAAQTLTGEGFTVEGSTTTELSDGGNDTCTLNSLTAATTTCVFNVKFSPARAGLRLGAISLSNATQTLITEPIGGTGVSANVSVDPATVTTIGTGITPTGVGTDLNGNFYVADGATGRVLKAAATGGTPTALIAGLSSPAQVAVDGAGNIYVADTGNNRIAMTSANGGTITPLGTGLSQPKGVAVDQLGNIFVADTGNNRVLQLTASGGQNLIATTGLSSPGSLATDAAGNVYVADTGNNRVLELPISSQQTAFNLGTSTVTPSGIAVDASGTLYVADSMSGQVLSYAPGVTNPEALVTGLTGPKGLAVDTNGSLYVADASAAGVLEANRMVSSTSFPNTNLNTSNASQLNVTNTGNASLLFNGPSFATATGNTQYFTLTAASSNGCVLATSMAAGSQCALIETFTPTLTGNFSETATLTTNAANSAQALLTGVGVFLVSTTSKLAVTQPTTFTINYAQAVTVTLTVTAASNAGAAPTGNVVFSIDGKKQTAQSLPASGILTVTLNPAVGTHVVSVSYSGDTLYASSSNSISFTVLKAVTTTTLSATPGAGTNPNLTLTATVSSTTATGETGTVTFFAGMTQIGTASVGTSGKASLTTSTISYTSYSFTAVYSGDANFAGSTSTALVPPGQFYIQPAVTAITVPQGSVGVINTSITQFFNYTGTLSGSCTGLPSNSVCRFNPTTITFTNPATTTNPASQPYAFYVYTNVQSNLASFGGGRWPWIGGLLAVLFGITMMRRRNGWRSRALLAAFVLVGVAGLNGCAGGVSHATSPYVTPLGMTSVVFTLTDSAGVSQSFTVVLTVNAAQPNP